LRLIRFIKEKRESFGLQTKENELLDLVALSKIRNQSIPHTVDKLILQGNEGVQALQQLVRNASENEKGKVKAKLVGAKMLAPVFSPPKIVCLGLNYRDHVAEQGAHLPDDLIIFLKPHTAVIGPDEPIVKPAFVNKLDYEAELAIIVGKRGKDIAVEEARDHIFGYTCFNDVSARDIQFKDRQWTRGKSFDTFAPIGPCITTASQIGDPTNLRIKARVNGELRQSSSTSNMVFNVYEVINELSRVMTLEPGDVIATGTPAGVGFAMKPKPKFLLPGDVVEIEIENVGTLRNKVVAV
jgi:2-keto-4-pentenoate hydratase/2-oxohepta-3-ene-1,7-dioic acid hydratase in catechol pathway